VPCRAQEPSPRSLETYAGKDLRKLDERSLQELRGRLEALTGDKPEKNEGRSFEPWWVKPFAAGSAAWVFLEAYPGYDVPDTSGVRVHVFDKNWKRLVKQSFPTGYRFFLTEVTVNRENPLTQDLLVAWVTPSGPFIRFQGGQMRPAFEQGDFQRQYYAVLSEQVVMVRLEDDKGQLARNHYRWTAPPKGPPVPTRTINEWVRSLRSPNAAEQLSTLVWLSGMHLPSTVTRQADVSQENVADSKLFEAVRDSEETRKALRELVNSGNFWVQEYARLALAGGGK
jgi:hypothetical protein